MGIYELLKTLKEITHKKEIEDFRGSRMGIDGYCWLHKSVYMGNCELSVNKESTKYLIYLRNMIRMMFQHGVTPILVFDGNRLPIKNKEDSAREWRRSEIMKKAEEFKEDEDVYRRKLVAAIDITPEMVYRFVMMLNGYGIEYIVAPYEADAQLAYLEYNGYIDHVCTFDSDLLAYGCKSVLFKLDLDGTCDHIRKEDIYKMDKFAGWSEDRFLKYCIMCGCDYFKIKGVGSKKAINYEAIELDEENTMKFNKAYLTFKLQVVYCPFTKKTRTLNSVESICDELKCFINEDKFYGDLLEDEIAYKVAKCIINPITYKQFNM